MSWPSYTYQPPRHLPADPPPAAPATARYGQVDPDDQPDPVVKQVAEAAAYNAAKQLGIPVPRVRWFTRVTPQLAEYRAKYWPGMEFKSWTAPANALGSAHPAEPGVIWLHVGQSASEAAETARHEVAHRAQFEVGLPADEGVAEAFALQGRAA